jgi:hypothetical protein
MSAYHDWEEGDEAPQVKVNEGFDSAGQAMHFARKPRADAGLSLGFAGGSTPAATVADGNVTCTDDDDTYIVRHRTTLAITAAITTTNWDDIDTYGRIGIATFAAGVLTGYVDRRLSVGGIFDNSAAPGAVDASAVTYTPANAADWDGSADPGDADQALDQLAERVTDLEVGGAGDEHYEVDGTPASDDTWGGRAITGVNAGATIAQWEAVYMGSGGEWLLADATDDTAAPCRGLAAAAGTDNNPMTVVTDGVIRNDAWNWTTLGAPIYLSTTTGGLTQTAPSATGEIVQPVGFAISADVMYLCIGAATFIEVA